MVIDPIHHGMQDIFIVEDQQVEMTKQNEAANRTGALGLFFSMAGQHVSVFDLEKCGTLLCPSRLNRLSHHESRLCQQTGPKIFQEWATFSYHFK